MDFQFIGYVAIFAVKTDLIVLLNHSDITPLETTIRRRPDYTAAWARNKFIIIVFAHVGHNKF